MAKVKAQITLGREMPNFILPDTKGEQHELVGSDAPATVVVFTCNHCPYALAWHGRLVQVYRDYKKKGVRMLMINSNDAERYPADSYESMQLRVRKERWAMPYLFDESQEAAHTWDVQVTPDVFVIDQEDRLRYRGAPDEDYENPEANAEWLRAALDDVLDDREVSLPQTDSVGCSVKWKL